jgi:hypothetical protein
MSRAVGRAEVGHVPTTLTMEVENEHHRDR